MGHGEGGAEDGMRRQHETTFTLMVRLILPPETTSCEAFNWHCSYKNIPDLPPVSRYDRTAENADI